MGEKVCTPGRGRHNAKVLTVTKGWEDWGKCKSAKVRPHDRDLYMVIKTPDRDLKNIEPCCDWCDKPVGVLLAPDCSSLGVD